MAKKSLMKMLCFRFCRIAFFLCRWQKTNSVFWAKYRFSVSQVKIEEYRYMILSCFRSSVLTYYVYRFSRPTSTRDRECDIYWYSIQIMVIWKSSFQNKYRYWYFWHVQNEFSLGMSKHQATFWLWKFFRTVN